jgi:hypothetical protein
MAKVKTRLSRGRRFWILLALAVALGALFVSASSGNLAGSPFDAGDGNLVLNDETQDWANAPNLQTAIDITPARNDNSFGQGTKEDTAVPTVVTGSIPPNKSDLTRFYVANQKVGGKEFLYLAWERVQEPQGTTNMDFEFNQSRTLSANGVTPVRTAGDVLIKYDLSQGGTNPVLGFHRWVTTGNPATVCEANNTVPCWGPAQPLGGNFEASINDPSNNPPTGSVVDPIPPNNPRTLSARTFGEAAINLTDSGILPSGTCAAFSGAYLKSRSSDSFTSALKDFIAPIPVNINNCGQIIIRKQTDPDGAAGTFSYSTTGGLTPSSFTLQDNGVQDYGNQLQAGAYSVTEADPSAAGFDFVSIVCSITGSGGSSTSNSGRTVNIDLKAGDIVDCTYTNRARGTIIVEKITDDGSGSFDFTSGTLTPSPFTLTTSGAGDAGKDSRTFSGLTTGTYDVAESVPAGWNLVSATCSDGSDPASIGLSAGETVTCTFHDARERGAILITKTRKHAADGPGDHPHAGVQFKITGGELPAAGSTVTTNAQGQACLDGLVLSSFVGDYTVHENTPAGYHGEADKTVSVTAEATCSAGPKASVSFHNTPLTDITVSVNSQVDGGTASTITCGSDSASTGPNGDGSLALPNKEPGTYNCTIVVDP